MIFSIHAYLGKWTSFLLQEVKSFSGEYWVGGLKSMPDFSLFKMAVKKKQLDRAYAGKECANCAGNLFSVAAHQTIQLASKSFFLGRGRFGGYIVVISKGVLFRVVDLIGNGK